MAASLQNLGGFTTPTPVAIGTRANPNWGSTFLGDLVTRPVFLDFIKEEIFERCAFVQSGVIGRNPALDASAGGVRVQLPFFRPLEITEEVIKSDATWGASGAGYLTPQKINAGSQIFPIYHRGGAFAVDDLSAMGSGTDPMAAIQSYFADALRKVRTTTLLSMLEGVFATALVPNVVSVARTSGTASEANFLSAANVIRATARLGERAGSLTAIAMHSNVAAYLKTVGMLTFSTSSLSTGGNLAWGGGGIGITSTEVANFAGLRVIVDDMLAPTIDATNGDKYPVYLFGPGVVQEGVQQGLRIEADRNILSKQSVMSFDYHYAIGMQGVGWAAAGDNPTNAELKAGASWSLAYETAKLIPAVKLVVNCSFAQNP